MSEEIEIKEEIQEQNIEHVQGKAEEVSPQETVDLQKDFQNYQEIQEPDPEAIQADYSAFDYELNQAKLDQIQKQIEEEDVAIISDVIDLTELEKEYANNQGFLQKILSIKKDYPHFRRVRRDGSCFYRAFLYKLLEQIVLYGDQQLQDKLAKIIAKSRDDLINVGYQSLVIEDFWILFKNKLDQVKSDYFTPDQLLSYFTDKETADTLNMYLRMLTSGHLKAHAAVFENFADFDLYGGVDGFCCVEVDPIDKDADQLQIIALSQYLQVSIKIIYLDSNIQTVQPTILVQPEDATNPDVTLLYRPGHYDILYGF